MKRLLPLLLLLLCSPSYGAIRLVASAFCGGLNSCTTSGIDTSGATLIVVGVTEFSATPGTVTDSKSNTYTALTVTTNSTTRIRLFYKFNPTVGSAHTFTTNPGGGVAPGLTAFAFFGTLTTGDPFDQQNGAGSAGTVSTIGTGNVTPTQSKELVVAEYGTGTCTSPPTINSTFSTPIGQIPVSTVNMGNFLAYKIQGLAALVNPTWTACSDLLVGNIATFKAAPENCAACDISGKLEVPF